MAKQQTPQPQRDQLPKSTTFGELEQGEWFQACGATWQKSADPTRPTWAVNWFDPQLSQEFFPQALVTRTEEPSIPLPELNTDGGETK